jgi:hypothetical protein
MHTIEENGCESLTSIDLESGSVEEPRDHQTVKLVLVELVRLLVDLDGQGRVLDVGGSHISNSSAGGESSRECTGEDEMRGKA